MSGGGIRRDIVLDEDNYSKLTFRVSEGKAMRLCYFNQQQNTVVCDEDVYKVERA